MAYEKEVQLLIEARNSGKPFDASALGTEGRLSLEDACRINERYIEERVKAGDRVAGFKIGLTNPAVREKLGFPDLMYGYLMDSMVLQNGVTVGIQELIAPKIECEICMKIKKKIKVKGLTVENVLDATEGVSGAFEICDARLREGQISYPHFFADNGFACRIVLQGVWHPPENVDFPKEEVVLSGGGKELGRGLGVLAMGHPAKAVAWLAGKLAERGRGLEPGQVVMTGTLTPILSVEKTATYKAAFSTLGEVTVTFA